MACSFVRHRTCWFLYSRRSFRNNTAHNAAGITYATTHRPYQSRTPRVRSSVQSCPVTRVRYGRERLLLTTPDGRCPSMTGPSLFRHSHVPLIFVPQSSCNNTPRNLNLRGNTEQPARFISLCALTFVYLRRRFRRRNRGSCVCITRIHYASATKWASALSPLLLVSAASLIPPGNSSVEAVHTDRPRVVPMASRIRHRPPLRRDRYYTLRELGRRRAIITRNKKETSGAKEKKKETQEIKRFGMFRLPFVVDGCPAGAFLELSPRCLDLYLGPRYVTSELPLPSACCGDQWSGKDIPGRKWSYLPLPPPLFCFALLCCSDCCLVLSFFPNFRSALNVFIVNFPLLRHPGPPVVSGRTF